MVSNKRIPNWKCWVMNRFCFSIPIIDEHKQSFEVHTLIIVPAHWLNSLIFKHIHNVIHAEWFRSNERMGDFVVCKSSRKTFDVFVVELALNLSHHVVEHWIWDVSLVIHRYVIRTVFIREFQRHVTSDVITDRQGFKYILNFNEGGKHLCSLLNIFILIILYHIFFWK